MSRKLISRSRDEQKKNKPLDEIASSLRSGSLSSLTSSVSIESKNIGLDQRALLVPVVVEALIVNDAVIADQSSLTPQMPFSRHQLNFDLLKNFHTPDQSNFDMPKKSLRRGIYLHWMLPSGLRHAISAPSAPDNKISEKKNENPALNNSDLQFPPVPNRWLVVRYYTSTIKKSRIATGWVIESDYVDFSLGNTSAAIPDPDPEKMRQTYMGRCTSLEKWLQGTYSSPITLNAVSNSNIHFSVYQPYCENVFSFVDTLNDVAETDTLSYLVTGWYADRNQDPLDQVTGFENFNKLLTTLKWQVQSSGEQTANSTLCHGMVYGLAWNRKGPLPPMQKRFEPDTLKLAVGSNALDAFTALVGQMQDFPELKTLLEAFNQGNLAKIGLPEAPEEITRHLHQDEFGHRQKDCIWVIKSTKSQHDSDLDDSPLGLTKQQAGLLDELNIQQRSLDTYQRLLEKNQWDLYALWWKLGRARCAKKTIPEGLDALVADGGQLSSRIRELQKKIADLTDICDKARNDLQAILTLENKILEFIHRSPLTHAQEPVLLISGLKSSYSAWKILKMGQLPCRFINQCINSFTIKKTSISNIDIQENKSSSLAIPPGIDRLPAIVQSCLMSKKGAGLFVEFFLLDNMNASVIFSLFAAKNNEAISLDEIKAAMSATNKDKCQTYQIEGSTYLPAYDLNAWKKQPWFPLMIQYAIDWSGNDFKMWEFNGESYVLKDHPLLTSTSIVNHGFLAPQSQFAFKGQLKRLIDEDPIFKKKFPDWQKLKLKINQWDLLSVTLSGLHNCLVQRSERMHRVPKKNNEQYLVSLIGDQAHTPPLWLESKIGTGGQNKFEPVRHGLFSLSQLCVSDCFGQSVTLLNAKNKVPIATSRNLTPDVDLKNMVTSYVQLRPRIMQSCRLNADWAANDAEPTLPTPPKLLFNNCQANPVIGWLLVNYLNQNLQIYNPTGELLLDELSIKTEHERKVCVERRDPLFLPTRYPYLHSLQNALHGDESGNPDAYNALLKIINLAFSLKVVPGVHHTPYLSAILGRPLALVKACWQLELAQPAYIEQNYDAWAVGQYQYGVEPESYRAFSEKYQFPVQLGSTDLASDGLVGYFLEQSDLKETFARFYTPYQLSSSSDYAIHTNALTRFTLSPKNPGIEDRISTIMLMDPFARVHAYTDILPVKWLQLPAIFVKPALQKMSLSFKLGPLLTTRSSCTDPVTGKEQKTVCLPQPSIKGQWSWLEPAFTTSSIKKSETALQPADSIARFGQPYEIIEGRLEFRRDETTLDKRKTLTALNQKPRRQDDRYEHKYKARSGKLFDIEKQKLVDKEPTPAHNDQKKQWFPQKFQLFSKSEPGFLVGDRRTSGPQSTSNEFIRK
ncbi:MAG: hypothetical protein JSR33_02090 [Proteobacteria bacterium]|nr:hypothetical protein [Pseudomonadota bacterium]